jgi:hypothetical protein
VFWLATDVFLEVRFGCLKASYEPWAPRPMALEIRISVHKIL